MSQPITPQNGEYSKLLKKNNDGFINKITNSKGKINLEAAREIEAAKLRDYQKTANFIKQQASIDEYIKVPKQELALLEHYSKIPGVEIDSSIGTFWKDQKDALQQINVKEAQNDYMYAFKNWQDNEEAYYERVRNNRGSGNIQDQKKKAREEIKNAKQRLIEATERRSNLEYEVDPIQFYLELFTLGRKSKSFQQRESADKAVADAKKAIKDRNNDLKRIEEVENQKNEALNKFTVKKDDALRKMRDAQQVMEVRKEEAKKIIENVKNQKDTLHKQYELIDKYLAIQSFKNKPEYPSIRAYLKRNNPDLFKKLEEVPEQLPAKCFKITLQGPLEITSNDDKITEVSDKITDLKGKLPEGFEGNDIQDEIDNLTLQDTDTVSDIDTRMNSLMPTCNEYKQLEIKKQHLQLQEKVEAKKSEIETLTEEIQNFSGDDKDLQAKLRSLKTKKDHLKVLEDTLRNDLYSKTLANLNELKKLNEDKNSLEEISGLQNLETTAEDIEQSNTAISAGSPITVAGFYMPILQKVLNDKKQFIEKRITQQSFHSYNYTR